MGLISSALIPALQEAFPNCGLRAGVAPGPAVVIPSPNPDIGEVRIWDDGDEATVEFEKVTHGHLGPGYPARPPEENAKIVAQMVLDFLRDLFADRVVLWGEAEHGGGWTILAPDEEAPVRSRGVKQFVWSGPYRGPEA